MSREVREPQVSLNGAAATGVGTAILIQSFRHANLSISMTGMGSGDDVTFKIRGSNQKDVDLSAAASASNRWDYIDVVDLEDKSSIDGDTGINITTANDTREFAINTDGLMWVAVEISALTDANASALFYAYITVYND